MQRKPVIYVVRKADGTEFKGSLEELKGWLSAHRITTEDEVRRLGYVVLEGDDLWTRVADRKELGFDVVSAREKLRKLQSSARISISIAVVAALVFATLAVIMQLAPRYDSLVDVREAERRHAAAISELQEKFDSERADRDKTIAALESQRLDFSSKLSEAEARLSTAQIEIQELSANNAGLSKKVEEYTRRSRDAETALAESRERLGQLARLDAANRSLAELRREVESAQQKLRALKAYPFVFEGTSYGMKTQSDLSLAETMREELADTGKGLASFEERVRVARDRATAYKERLDAASWYDKRIYKGLCSDADRDLRDRQSELELAMTAYAQQREKLFEHVRANSY